MPDELQGERLVEMVPNCGARVRGFDAAGVRNMFDVRIALESMLARRGAERIKLHEVSALKGIEARFELCVKRREYASALATAYPSLETLYVESFLVSAAAGPL